MHPRLGKALEFFFPRRSEGIGIDLNPEGVFEIGKRHAFAAQGPLQAQSFDDFACFAKKRGARCGKRRAAGALIDKEPVATLSGIEDALQGDRIQLLVLLDGEEASLCAAVAMMSKGFASADDELFAGDRLEALIEEACRNRALDTRREQRLELLEQPVLRSQWPARAGGS